MKNCIQLLAFFACFFANLAQAEPIPISTKIEKVTVFLNGAQVNRKGQISLNAGKQELVFKGISPKISPQSIQVKLEGENTLLSVVHQLNHIEEQNKRTEIDILEKQQTLKMEKIVEEKAMLSVYAQEEAMLNKNQDIKGEQTGLKTADLREALDFHRQRLTELKMKVLEGNKKLAELGNELGKINQQLVALNQKKDLSTSEILVTIQSPKAQNVGVVVSYFVNEAKWFPTYDIRVKDIASPLFLAYKANVLQSSGEDWSEVKLTLSTGNPSLGGEKPKLNTWYLGYYSPSYNSYYQATTVTGQSGGNTISQVSGRITDRNNQPVIGATVSIVGGTLGAFSDDNGYYVINDLGPNDHVVKVETMGYESQQIPISSNVHNIVMNEIYLNVDLSEVAISGKKKVKETKEEIDFRGARNGPTVYIVDGVKVRGTPDLPPVVKGTTKIDEKTLTEFSMTTIQFEIETPYTIPTDGKNYMVEIKTHEIPAFYEYYCAPKLDPDAFLTANIKDWADYHLINGETNLFFEGTFIGKAYLNLLESDDTLSISLGRDKSVIINRELLKDFSQKQFIGNYKTQSLAYQIAVRNTKKLPINLTLEDQYPVSNQKEITVERIENKDAKVEENTGKLTWKLNVEANKEKKVSFKYSVKYPKNSNVLAK